MQTSNSSRILKSCVTARGGGKRLERANKVCTGRLCSPLWGYFTLLQFHYLLSIYLSIYLSSIYTNKRTYIHAYIQTYITSHHHHQQSRQQARPHEELKELRDARRSLFSLWPGGHKWPHQKILTVRSASIKLQFMANATTGDSFADCVY